jgi:hypothetical protein
MALVPNLAKNLGGHDAIIHHAFLDVVLERVQKTGLGFPRFVCRFVAGSNVFPDGLPVMTGLLDQGCYRLPLLVFFLQHPPFPRVEHGPPPVSRRGPMLLVHVGNFRPPSLGKIRPPPTGNEVQLFKPQLSPLQRQLIQLMGVDEASYACV